MIGPGWDGDEPMLRPDTGEGGDSPRPRRIAVITGTRAEYGLLRTVMRSIQARADCELIVIAAGSHLIQPALTFREVKADFEVADSVPMQVAGRRGRLEDAEAVGRGISRFVRSFRALEPDWVVVLGDRIEAFAAASAASIGWIGVAHLHGGDRAEGVADEAMRHAITKLAHLHLPATDDSRERILRMGERPEQVHTVGSPAIDELSTIDPLDDSAFTELGSPEVVFMFHPVGRHDEEEELAASQILSALDGLPALALHPNQDPGRSGIVRAIDASAIPAREHMARAAFVGLLKRLASTGGILVGNSSAGLIEAAALTLPVVDIGPRQSGRLRPENVVHADAERTPAVREAIERARSIPRDSMTHPYGDGRTGERAASIIARSDPGPLLRKHNAY
ncbi:MAG: UDP-N-acetylglucosamine 2-epimerase [Planctomycetota bacterium]